MLRRRFLQLQLLLVVFPWATRSDAPTAQTCCATCLAQPNVGAADAVDFTACSAAQTTCCFDQTCSPASFGTPTFDLTLVSFVGTSMVFPSGNWLRLQWPAATDVKYIALKTNQPKLSQVTNASVSATAKDTTFFICPTIEGTLYLRGFAAGGCTASKELNITISPGNRTNACSDSSLPTLPPASLTDSDCDPVRGAIVNGICTCLEDYAGPPQCLSNSVWRRWGQIVTYIAGGLSALTAMFGLYRFYKMRKAKQERLEMEQHRLDNGDGHIHDTPQYTTWNKPMDTPPLLPPQSQASLRSKKDDDSVLKAKLAPIPRRDTRMESEEVVILASPKSTAPWNTMVHRGVVEDDDNEGGAQEYTL
ncbi:hypothetical protein AC1031_017223 [Aphanomyces cochlioides]|nr:hypothetical protein AC1031_017223 [Aphanomyces cochlioides]